MNRNILGKYLFSFIFSLFSFRSLSVCNVDCDLVIGKEPSQSLSFFLSVLPSPNCVCLISFSIRSHSSSSYFLLVVIIQLTPFFFCLFIYVQYKLSQSQHSSFTHLHQELVIFNFYVFPISYTYHCTDFQSFFQNLLSFSLPPRFHCFFRVLSDC